MSDVVVDDPLRAQAVLTPLPPFARPSIGHRAAPYALVGPLMLFLAVFTLLPSALILVFSFFNIDILAGTYRFIGLANFRKAISHGELLNSLKVTFLYILLTVPPSMVFGLLAALAIHALKRGAGFWRAVYFLPVAATLVAMSIVWRWMFLANKGVVDLALERWTGLSDWLNSPALALPAVAIVGNWQQIGFVAILYLAGLASVPKHVLEAARVDGAGAWSRFWHVTWPSLGPTTVFAGIISSIGALRVFDTIATMTAGGPSQRTETLAYLMWQRGIYFFDIGGGAVVALVLLALALVATAIQRRMTARLERAGSR
ncbi:sugar ABC transporter permease [Kaistia sp. 32K]|uniref:carbohydrate ABC transporter permease n=1 Tax=Kaistia sp. 32K TaxID=2795690 RepID=UPI001915505A|nr:sugar ABC transporter permease [Kaistia sp. 32K]BCP56340.1 sugar ABC transporter permease [Kaistia sp. 32K]